MKIAYVVHGYTDSGGTERVLAKKANYFIEQGHEVSIISMKEETSKPFFSFSSKIKFYHLNIKKSEKESKELFLEQLSDCLAGIKPDISISMGFGLSIYLYKIKDGSKKVLEIHFSKYKRKHYFTTWDKYYLGRVISNIYEREKINAARHFDSFVVLTDEDKESWRDMPNIEVIPNPISFMPEEYSDVTAKRVLAAGRYTYQKGFEYLIDIWNEIAKKYPDWKLSIFGDGSKKKLLETRIKKFNLSESVELLPITSNIQKEMMNSSVYALTSRYEGLPLVLIEAMACGLPAVAFACKCGPRDVIENGEDGFLIEFKNKNAFAEKLSLLIENEELRRRMGKSARTNIQRFNTENVMPKWESLFERLLATN